MVTLIQKANSIEPEGCIGVDGCEDDWGEDLRDFEVRHLFTTTAALHTLGVLHLSLRIPFILHVNS